jgi:hypothetical protein
MRSNNRRTVFLGVLATLSFGWAAIYQFDVPVEEMAWLLLYCVIGVLAVAILAGLTVGLVLLLRRLLGPGPE